MSDASFNGTLRKAAMKNPKLTLSLLAVPLLVAALSIQPRVIQAEADEAGTISGNVYCDSDRNGICDCEETGLKGIPIQIFFEHCGGVAIQTVSTDQQGNFSFRNFEPGTYFVRVHLDYVCGGRKPTTASCREITLAEGESVTLPAFGYSEFGQ
jgi:hypothetical protein